jgi:hypothetical protein
MKFFDVLRKSDYAIKFAQACGVDIHALAAKGDPVGDAKTALAMLKGAPNPKESSVAELTSEISKKRSELAELRQKAQRLRTAPGDIERVCAEFLGITLTSFHGLVQNRDAFVAAVKARVEMKAREMLCKHGITPIKAIESKKSAE